MNSLSRIITAFLIYMVSIYITITIIPSLLLGTPSQYIRPFQLVVFSNILILVIYIVAYLALGGKMLSYIVQISLASLAITYYLDIFYRINQGVRIDIHPLFTTISDPTGSSTSIDLGQISIIALALIYIKNRIYGRKYREVESTATSTHLPENHGREKSDDQASSNNTASYKQRFSLLRQGARYSG